MVKNTKEKSVSSMPDTSDKSNRIRTVVDLNGLSLLLAKTI